MNQEQLIEIAKEIVALNPECLLSGSLALNLQGMKTLREPKDLDFYLPYKVELKKPEGMIESEDYGDNGEYDDEGCRRRGFKYKGVKIDIFQPEDEDLGFNYTSNLRTHNMPCVQKLEILALKIHHAFGDASTKYKHRNDLIFHLISS